MKKADNAFFEAFKELETLCGEIYSCRSGVSEYILDMEKNMSEGERKIGNWANDYKTLKHLRWVRNKIAHEAGDIQISEDQDLDAVCAFRDRVIRGKDPITLLTRARKAAKPVSSKPVSSKPAASNPAPSNPAPSNPAPTYSVPSNPIPSKPALPRSSAPTSGKSKTASRKKQKKNLIPIVIAVEVIVLLIGLYLVFRMTAGL